MQKPNSTNTHYTPIQLKLPLEIDRIIDISDPVYSFNEILDHIDLNEFLTAKECRTGRPRCDAVKLLKSVLFSFMENGYLSLRNIEKACKTDIRYMWLLDGMKTPSHVTFGNFIKNDLSESVEKVFQAVNNVIFEKEKVDTEHAYIDGTKIEANANKYTWVWKKACIRSRDKVFGKITDLLNRINTEDLIFLGVKLEQREAYAIEYVDQMLDAYKRAMQIDEASFVNGKGHHKSSVQRKYEELKGYRDRLKNYAKHIEICGEVRNSYSKTDHDATFMRVKRDYMGNDQLLPAYNMQAVICDEYIAAIDARQYASDIQAEGTYGSVKWNRSYKRAFRRGLKDVILEFTLIAIGFNLWKYHNKARSIAGLSESA